ncbi:DUF2243 domain-containing protein [Stutzerimonas azotifigens]|uniref:DUF2243 domain-containing protein n=1 Tax=Stutzerimonas azotifigens TaxID=291995 RepID=UPI000418E5FC|nr:DUF2243 domain-containing protein [Stutzerimonas azotifigens]
MESRSGILDTRRSLLATALIGVGLMAAIDEIVFHQLLAWHHFFDRATPAIGLLSDGLLHAAELILLVAGFFLFAELRQRRTLAVGHAWAGLFLGAGGFQLFDGIVDHKVLRVHQVRYVEDLWLYDLGWNAAALLLLLIGALLWRRARRGALTRCRWGWRRCSPASTFSA